MLIAKTLGHTSLQHVHIYARLDTQSQRTALDEQAERMLGPVPVVPSKDNRGSASPNVDVSPDIMSADFLSVREPREDWPG